MATKQRISENLYGMALQRLNDMVKAKLPELYSPEVVIMLVGSTFEHQTPLISIESDLIYVML